MRLDIASIRELSGAKLAFDYELDLSELDIFGECPLPDPVRVYGQAVNHADVLELHMTVEFTLKTPCGRCLKPLEVPASLQVERPMADEVANEDSDESDEIILLESGTVELDELAVEAILLNAQMSYLCREDCRGLCPECGADLNEGPCACQPEPDPRFAALGKFFGQDETES